MTLSRRSMRSPRNLSTPPGLVEDVLRLIHDNAPAQNVAIARAIEHIERNLNLKLEKVMATLEETLALVEAQNTRVDSLIALTADLHQKVIDALGSGLTPSQQMRVDAVFDEVKAEADKVDAAITANTVHATAGAVSDGPSASDIKANLSDSGGTGQQSQT